MSRVIVGALLILGPTSAGSAHSVHAQQAAVAIVVNASTVTSDISSVRLRKIFMGDDQYLDKNRRVVLLVPSASAPEWIVLLKRVYRMSAAQYRQYWIGKLFRAEVSSGPEMVDQQALLKMLALTPGAITFMPASEVGRDLKVLRIDGKLPGDAAYKLK
jgi:hypothetical protein